MRFNPRARLNTGQVRVRRGGGGGGGFGGMGGFPVPSGGGGLRVGGGIGGLIVIVIVVLLSGGLGGLTGGGGFTAAPDAAAVDTEGIEGLERCRTGEDANSSRECAMVASINSIQAFWTEALPDEAGMDYQESLTVFFTGSTSTGCGGATSAVGPFYCPADKNVYLDRTFFRDMLQGQLGARGGEFSEAYVLAHEYGHHVQDLLGTMSRVRTQQGATSDAVRLELQADCYAGMWAKYATEVEDANGEVFILELTQDDISRAIDAAQAVGDDRIQKASSGRVNPEQWTHGSAASRAYWFQVGMSEGTVKACDTFRASDLHVNG